MTKAQLSTVARRMARHLPSFAAHRSLLFLQPLDHTLRGILLERSGDPRRFYVNVFLQPLSVPEEFLVLNAGWRLGGGAHAWSRDAENFEDELRMALLADAVPFLSRVNSASDAAAALRAMPRTADPIVVRMTAYAHVRAGEIPEASRTLDQLLAMLAGDVRPYVREMYEHDLRLKETLAADASQARRQLVDWERQTTAALGLSSFARSAT